jgi:hypothetical protein
VSLYVSGPKRLRSSSGHGVDWRTGVLLKASSIKVLTVCIRMRTNTVIFNCPRRCGSDVMTVQKNKLRL